MMTRLLLFHQLQDTTHGNYGPDYLGLTRKRGLGQRLKDHLWDDHAGLWDRFSWFGFRQVLAQLDGDGICQLKGLASVGLGTSHAMIGDLEALLINAMGLTNKAKMKFFKAREWNQIKGSELDTYLPKVRR